MLPRVIVVPVKQKKSAPPPATPRLDSVYAVALSLGVLIILTVAVYWNGLHGEFVFDDQQIVMQNAQMLNIHSFSDVLHFGLGWRQLLFFTYGLNYYLSGLNTFSYHVLNLLIHVINVLLVYFIVFEMSGRGPTRSRYAAFTGAAVFSVHGLMSSAVDYIAGRSSVLCGLFYFLAVLLFLRAIDDEAKPSRRISYLVLTAVSGVLAWQAKQEALTLPALLAAIFWLRSRKRDLRYVAALAVLPLILAATMWKTLQALFSQVMDNRILVNAGFDTVLKPPVYFWTYLTAEVEYYLPRFVFPSGLNADPNILPVNHWYSPELIISLLILSALAWLILRPSQSEPLLSAGVAALLISPLTAYVAIPLADVVLEHRAYIPGLAIGFLFAAFFRWLIRDYPGARIVAPAVVVIVFAAMTIERNPVFANNVALWQDAVQKSPNKSRAHFNLGAAYQNAHFPPAEAIQEYQAALALKPDIHAAYSNMAAMQIDNGQFGEGEKTLVKLTQIAPEYTEGFINLSVLYLRMRQTDKAIAAADRALKINSESFAAHYNKAEALTQKGDFKAAVPEYEKSVYLRPDINTFRMTLGAAYVRAGDYYSAEETFRNLLKTELAAEAYRNLGNMYTAQDKLNQAVDCLKQAIQIRSNYPDAHHDLGVAYMSLRETDPAIEEFKATLSEVPDYGPAVLNLSLAYQTKGDSTAARQVLESYLRQFGSRPSEFLTQIQNRLASLH